MNTNEIKETTEKELAKAYKRCFWSAVVFVVGVFISMMLCGCKQTEYVTVPEVHEVHHHHTDSVHEVDSVIQERNTIIRELDSAAMAKYGIQLKNAQRAWLVETNELRREIERLQAIRNDSTAKVDSVPYPVPVPTPVPAELSWWQQTRLHIANIVLYLLGICAAVWIIKRKFRKIIPP